MTLQNHAILILGMHRSGTSALARVLNLLGAQIGSDLLPPAPDNPKGFWEHRGVTQVQDRILDALDREWLDATAIPEGWQDRESVRALLAELREILSRDFSSAALWAVKDPRICLLLPAWETILSKIHCRGSCALILRNPVEVVDSLEKRDKLSRPRIYMLWLRHMLSSERFSRTWPRAIVRYDRLLADWRAQVDLLQRRLGVTWPKPPDQAAAEIDAFLDRGLRHHQTEDDQLLSDESVPQVIRRVYRAFLQTEQGDDSAFQSELDAVRDQVDHSDELTQSYLTALQVKARNVAKSAAQIQEQLNTTLASLQQQQQETELLRQTQVDGDKTQRESRDQMQRIQRELERQTQLRREAQQSEQRTAQVLGRQIEESRELLEESRAQQRRTAESLQHQTAAAVAVEDQLRRTINETKRDADDQRLRAEALERVASRVRISLGWRATQWFRSLRCVLHPLQLTKSELIASEQLQRSDQSQWMVTGAGAHFLAPCLPMSKWIRLDLQLHSSVPGRMEMQFDNGGGFYPGQSLDLGEVAGETTVSIIHRVPNGTHMIKWSPLDRPGAITVHRWDVTVLPTWRVYARLAMRALRRAGIGAVPSGVKLLALGRLPQFLLILRNELPPAVSKTQKSTEAPTIAAPVEAASMANDPSRLQHIQVREPGVNLYALLGARSGLGTAGRGYAKALRASGLPIEAHEVASWKCEDPSDTAFFDGGNPPIESLSGYRVNFIHQNADMLPYFIARYGAAVLKGKYNISGWVWELPSFRPDYQRYLRKLDEVWAPSEFVRQAVASISPIPVVRVPYVVEDLEKLAIHDRAHFGLPSDVFIFQYSFDVSSYMERKNPLMLIDAFKRVFGDSEKVLLLLKYHSMSYNAAAVKNMKKAALAPNIRLLPGVLSDEETASLHKLADALVSPHRAEGFGLNIAESMYFGKAVVATGYSGNVDFMSPQNSYPVDYDLVAIDRDTGPYLSGYLWANPRFNDLCEKMKLAFEDESGRKARGEKARQTIRDMLSAQAVGKIIRERFNELGLTSTVKESAVIRPPKERIVLPPTRRGVDYDTLPHQPTISILTPVYNVPPEYLDKCIRSVIDQTYPNWELCICDDCSTDPSTLAMLYRYQGTDPRIKIVRLDRNRGIAQASNRAVEVSTGEFLAMLDNDDELHPDALYWFARAINDNPRADLIYSDEDKIELDGRHTELYYKPDWSPEHLRSVMYLLHLLVVRRGLFLRLGMFREEFSGAQDYDLALRVSEVTENIVHVPRVLYHWRKIPGSAAAAVDAKPGALRAARRALEEHTARVGLEGEVVDGKLDGMFRVRPKIRGNPPVTLAITTDARTADVPGRGKIDLVHNFVQGIRPRTTYHNYCVLVVDNGNLSPRQRRQLLDEKCQIVSYDGPQSPFNFARKANFTFANVQTEHLVLLNDDMEVIDGDWLTALLELSQLRDVGAVGAKLITPDHRIQHAGVVLGVNNGAAHVYHGYPADTVGYGGFPNLIRNFSAVTGACLATRKSVIAQVGGFDERFAIDYNDTSFCLAARKAGYRIVYTPYCELYHFESASAPRTAQNPVEVELFCRLWGETVANDPYYNPNLPRGRHDYVLEG